MLSLSLSLSLVGRDGITYLLCVHDLLMNETALVESGVYLCVHLDFLAGGIVAECCDSSQLERRLHGALATREKP